MSSHSYNVDGFLKALVSAKCYCNAAPELRDWHQVRADALREALGLEKDDSAGPAPIIAEHMLKRAIAEAAEHSVIHIRSALVWRAIAEAAEHAEHPFSGYMKCPKELYELGRNDSCPCGSGKKFKKCCAGHAPTSPS
jgi:hypothetical protein